MAEFRAWGSPHRYIQGPNILENISQYTNIFGKKVGLIITKNKLQLSHYFSDKIQKSLCNIGNSMYFCLLV
jgi:glycerol dehydrogenase-like iron-containing ADH family enzyme